MNDNVRAWTDGIPLEDATRQQIHNVASLPILAGPVAVMPDAHAGKGATVGTVIATRGAIIPAAVGVDIGCFHGDTKVPLLDGTQATMRDLEHRTEPFWVYSIGTGGRITPGLARCRKTRRNARLMRVVVSGGDEVLCTPDHQFMLSEAAIRRRRI